MSWIDVTLPLEQSTPPYPGDPGLSIQRLMDYECGDALRLSAIAMSAHLGTHVDAPLHFIRNGASVDQIALEKLLGPAHVIEALTNAGIHAQQLSAQLPLSCTRVLLKTSTREALLPRPTAWLEPEAARLLAARKVKLVGIDSPSVDEIGAAETPAHHILLESGVVIVENLMLHAIAAGAYEMICLPLQLVGLEGAPARVILQRKR